MILYYYKAMRVVWQAGAPAVRRKPAGKAKNMQYLAVYLIVMNVIAFIVYGADKAKARRGQWRVSERTLLALAALGGALGAQLGMSVFRHKTKHRKFTMCVPLFMTLWGAALAVLTVRLH